MLRQTDVRDGYENLREWTPGEAARYVDRSVPTIYRWRKEPLTVVRNGHTYQQYRFRRSRAIGAACIDPASFKRYIETGEPQGERA